MRHFLIIYNDGFMTPDKSAYEIAETSDQAVWNLAKKTWLERGQIHDRKIRRVIDVGEL